MTARLVISEDSYVLQQATETGWNDLAVLPGGATALLPDTRPLHEGSLELAIELAENWLMPHARHLRGDVLEVSDTTGRLTSGLMDVMSESATSWSVADLEQLFLRWLTWRPAGSRILRSKAVRRSLPTCSCCANWPTTGM